MPSKIFRALFPGFVFFVGSLSAAQVPLWELGSNPGLVAPAWQGPINGSGNVTASAGAWNVASTGSYTGVQVGVGGATPALVDGDRIGISLRRGSGHSAAMVRVIFISSDWSRQSAYEFPVAAASLSGSIFGLVDSTGTVGAPVATVGGGVVWGTDSLAAIQFINQNATGSPVMNLDVQSIVGVSASATIGRPLVDCGSTVPQIVPSSVSGINGGTLTVTPDLWRISGSSINSGVQFAMSGSAAVATRGRALTDTLVLRVRPAAGQTLQALDVEFLNAAWSRSSTYRFPLAGLPTGKFSEVAATTPLGSPIAATGGGLQFGSETIGAMKLYGTVGGSTLNVDIERISTTDGNRFADWLAVRGSLGFAGDSGFTDYINGAAPDETVESGTPVAGVSGNRLQVGFVRDPRRADVRMDVEASGDLAAWTPIARSIGGAPFASLGSLAINDPATTAPAAVTVADNQTLMPTGSRFLRIRAQATSGSLGGGGEKIDSLHHNLGEIASARLYQAEPFGLPPLPAPAFPSEGAWTPAAWQDGNATQTGTITPRNPRLKYTGRILSYAWNDFVEFTWSGTQIEARFNGPSVRVDLEGNEQYFNIVIDGDYRNMRAIRVKGRQIITLAENLTDGPHDLQIFHRTGVSRGLVKFRGLVLGTGHGLVSPAPRPSRRIEFIGDSITAGQVAGMREGYEGSESGEHHDKDNAFLSYSTLTARALGAEGHFIAWPGIAMAQGRGYTGTIYMPAAWLKAVPINWDLPGSPNWDFTQWQPQVVVINLFQNDMSVGGSDTGNLSRDAYVNFLKDVRLKYGDNIRIFCVAGNMSLSSSANWKQAITDAVNIFKTDTGHTAVETLFFPYKNTGGHPRVSEQQAMADALVPVIKARMGW